MARHSETMNHSRQRQPTFFWQGVLIVLPVVVLAGAAVFSLRQDRILAHHEATERANALAQEAADAIWAKLTAKGSLDPFRDHTFAVDADGKLIFPPPAPALPVPQVFDLSLLSPPQRENWSALQVAETDGSRRSAAIDAGRKFLDSNPPETFAAVAQFRFAQLLAANGNSAEAAAAFAMIDQKFPEARSESGLPLGPLAELKTIELSPRSPVSNAVAAVPLNSFCSNLVNRPSYLTAHLLTQATALQAAFGVENVVEPWRQEWERHEPLRTLAAAALAEWARTAPSDVVGDRPSFPERPSPVPALSWFEAHDLSPNPQPVLSDAKEVNGGMEVNQSRSHKLVAALIVTNQVSNVEVVIQPHMSLSQQTPRKWLATRIDNGKGGYSIVCRVMGFVGGNRESTLGSPVWLALRESLPVLPPWLGATIELAGVPLLTSNDLQVITYEVAGKGSGQAWRKIAPGHSQELLATAQRLENGTERLRVNVHLVSRDLLFGRQRTRSYLFGFLIAAAAAAALIGFVSARRAFFRQQQLSEMKSNFVSSVSHELRAPIASVRLLAESLERGRISEPTKQNEYFRFIVQECRRLSSLIENVLDFARIEQGRQQYDLEPLDLPALVRQTVKLMEPVAAEKQISLVIDLDDAQVSNLNSQPCCDAQAIQQALVNLLDNAVKHSPSGSEVVVGLKVEPPEGDAIFLAIPPAPERRAGVRPALGADGAVGAGQAGRLPYIRLWVQDHGPGIPVEEHERIFERFYRPGSELRRESPGVGIGLSIVKHIVEAHGGRVRVESEVGQGSRFTIELPLQPTTLKV